MLHILLRGAGQTPHSLPLSQWKPLPCPVRRKIRPPLFLSHSATPNSDHLCIPPLSLAQMEAPFPLGREGNVLEAPT